MTLGTLAAMILSDQLLEKENPLTVLFNPRVSTRSRQARSCLRESVNDLQTFVVGRLSRPPREDVSSLAEGEGRIIGEGRERVAAYRDEEGRVFTVSAICPHMGCTLFGTMPNAPGTAPAMARNLIRRAHVPRSFSSGSAAVDL